MNVLVVVGVLVLVGLALTGVAALGARLASRPGRPRARSAGYAGSGAGDGGGSFAGGGCSGGDGGGGGGGDGGGGC
ncbi:hypothetical protein [Pseudonocardia kongjuensis]|uniref:hypothetical protein n=1 Tax=Pseudonocardia kongjuensis TaxID=102227 RepID=UPI0031DF7424